MRLYLFSRWCYFSSEKRRPCVLRVQFRRSAGAFYYAPRSGERFDAVARQSVGRVEHGRLVSGTQNPLSGRRESVLLLWWKVLEERKTFSISTTTNTPTPRCVLCCPRWAVLIRRYSFLSVSSTLLDLRFSSNPENPDPSMLSRET